MTLVKMLSVKGCLDCAKAIEDLKSASKKSGIGFDLHVYDISQDKAVDIAIEYNLESVPAFVIGNIAIDGPYFKEEEIIAALEKSNEKR